jgi:hypothetical protein
MLNLEEHVIADIMTDVRERDAKRLEIEITQDVYASRDLIHGNAPLPPRS